MSPEISTRALLHALAEGRAGHSLTLGDLLDQFRARAFGVFLLIAVLPAFVPLPIGAGAISGPLVSLIGLQLMLQLAHPCRLGFEQELARAEVGFAAKRPVAQLLDMGIGLHAIATPAQAAQRQVKAGLHKARAVRQAHGDAGQAIGASAPSGFIVHQHGVAQLGRAGQGPRNAGLGLGRE